MNTEQAISILKNADYYINYYNDNENIDRFIIVGANHNKPFYGPYLITSNELISFAYDVNEYVLNNANNFLIYNPNTKEDALCRTN